MRAPAEHLPHVDALSTGNWQRALLLLEEMSSREFTPNTVVYGSAIHACVVGGEPRRALALLDEMVNRGVVPDAAAFTAGMRAADGWASALRLLEAMKRHVSLWTERSGGTLGLSRRIPR